MEFLKDKEKMETFRLTLSNKYETLQDLLDEENMEVNPHWECLKNTWTSTCEEVLGKKKEAEAIKADMETSIEMLYDLIGKIWETDEIPIGWKEA